MKELSELLKNIRENVPSACFKCPKKCYECCTHIQMSKEEEARMIAYMNEKWIEKQPHGKWRDYCEYLDKDGSCTVREERPMICRAFGVCKSKSLVCKYFEKEQMSDDNPASVSLAWRDEYFMYMQKSKTSNINGKKFEKELLEWRDPIDVAIYLGEPYVIRLAKEYLNAFIRKECEAEALEKPLIRLQLGMKMMWGTLSDHIPINFEEEEK